MTRQKPEFITTSHSLEQLVARLCQERVLACDLEGDSLHHYQERVCLIQLSTGEGSFLVDPLAIDDMSPLAPLMADPSIKKVFHGADYDIRSLHRDFGIEVCNLFDSMIACQLLGEKEVGLAAVLKKRFGVELDKKFQKADWSRRPLSEGMIDYAIRDTILLIELYRQLERELAARGRLAWLEEECELLSRVRATGRNEEPLFSRFKGAARMDGRTLAVLEELLRFRDEKARIRDVPPFKVLGNEQVRALAEKKPHKPADLQSVPGMPAAVAERYCKEILAAVARGIATPAEQLPRFPRLERVARDPKQEGRLKILKRWREKKAEVLGMEAGILANNNLLEGLAEAVPFSLEQLDLVCHMKKWQKREFGAEIISILARGD
ncbi:ribonuclease D [Geobacter sp. DSM 9736]|uniref:ribonuclease D n=1 Tax=Geobacter sp. DSM 9736 TaxID=1277350 RepID=UPI000B620B88|nr:ribonuclease D [Geobacter sp. DSM 9736]SNB47573.1 ribonuclease D [Geobacter sp. DSM 9736]